MTTRANYLLVRADARRIPLADRSVHMVCTSPPYWSLRDYGVVGQIGLEDTPEAYVAAMVGVFREVWRVLRDDGTVWLNIGDSYNSSPSNQQNGWFAASPYQEQAHRNQGRKHRDCPGLKPKDLVGIPWALAFALRADGWYLRSEIIWHKRAPMPESVTDRPTKAHEQVFLLAKRERYFFDAEAVKEGAVRAGERNNASPRHPEYAMHRVIEVGSHRNLRSVWSIASTPFEGAHFAVMPTKLVEPCIKAGTSERGVCPACGAPWERMTEREAVTPKDYNGKHLATDPQGSGRRMLANMRARREAGNDHDNPFPAPKTLGWRPSCPCPAADPIPAVVFDPFGGAATTAVVALGLGRSAVATELNPDYLALARHRLERPHARMPGPDRDDAPFALAGLEAT
jgi:DNA modification methylase